MRVRKPAPFVFPSSKFRGAKCGRAFFEGKYIQLYTGGTRDIKTVRRLAKWLEQAAKWMEKK